MASQSGPMDPALSGTVGPCSTCSSDRPCTGHAAPKLSKIRRVPRGVSPPQSEDRGDTLNIMCVEGHGRSLYFEVDSFDDGIPAWVQRWMEIHAADNVRDEVRSEAAYESDEDSSSISVDSAKDITTVVGSGTSLILLSDSDSD